MIMLNLMTRVETKIMKILALEAYYDGSHRAFLESWIGHSRHDWTVISLPGYKWKWRMRHAAITFAREVNARVEQGQCWDGLFCSDMVNCAELRGLLTSRIAHLPILLYFHENQLTYPVRHEEERDYQFAMTNITSALAADAVWFNSGFHRESFLTAARTFLKKMPDHQPLECVETIRQKSSVHTPGVSGPASAPPRSRGVTTILWAARWEHDKNPSDFFAALESLVEKGIDFRVSVIGQQFREVPAVFAEAMKRFAPYVRHWGYQPSKEAYCERLAEADIIVSTALHEFFGIGVVEAVAHGVYPLVPARLAYPEVLGLHDVPGADRFFYEGSVPDLAAKLAQLIAAHQAGVLWKNVPQAQRMAQPFDWTQRAPAMDHAFPSGPKMAQTPKIRGD
jgi:glycosyltransferase involved in cell wall biosynthesis